MIYNRFFHQAYIGKSPYYTVNLGSYLATKQSPNMLYLQRTANYQHCVVVIFILVVTIQDCLSIRFYLQPHQKKCLKSEMYADQLAVGEYELSSLEGTTVDMSITDSKGHIALKRENIEGKGKFAVTSDGADIYDLCFTYTTPPGSLAPSEPRELSLEFRVGAEAKEFDTDSDHEVISDLERELSRVDSMAESIIIDFAYLKRREKEMRDTNESTNTRLFYQTVTSVIILSALTTWQILYLRTFFRARKLID